MSAAAEPVVPVSGGGEQAPQRLARGVLSTFDIASSTLANIAPAMSFYFSVAYIASFAGIASPLTVIAAGIAIALLGNTLSQFVRLHPSVGSFVTFIGRGFGGYSAVFSAVVLGCGYMVSIAAVIAIGGGWTETILHKYLSITIPWQIITLVITLGVGWLIIQGAKPSTKAAAVFFGFELLLLVGVSVAVLIQHHSHINLQPFNPSNLPKGFSSMSLGFPLAIYLFIGWENSATLAEESANPRKAVPRAIFTAIAVILVVYVFLTFATTVGVNNNPTALATGVPFITAAGGVDGFVLFLAYIAGFTSIFSCLIAAVNSQSRILFNSGREGLLPKAVGRVHPRLKTPYMAVIVFMAVGLVLVYVFAWLVSGATSAASTVGFFGEIATLGAILVSFVYLLTNLALPVYIYRHHRDKLNPVTHVLLPMLGVLAIGYPLERLIATSTGPEASYPWISLGIVAVSAIWAGYVYRRDPGLGERVGSIVADAD